MENKFQAILSIVLLILTLFVYGKSHAEPVTPPQRQIDLSRALVEFKVKVIGFLNITGQFRNVRGSIVDPGPEDNPELDITVTVESVDTRHSIRDSFLRGPAFFDAEQFPTIRFSQARLLNSGNGRKKLAGKLTLHGVTQPIVFELTSADTQQTPAEAHAGTHAAHTIIKRSDFGLDGFRSAVSDNVEIVISLKDKRIGFM